MLKISQVYRHKFMRWPTHIKVSLALLGLLVGQIAPVYTLIAKVHALSDITPVTVEAFTASTNSVTVDSSIAQVELNGTVSDDLSGFASMQVYYTSPSGKQVVEGHVVSSTETSFQVALAFPRYSEPGTWVPTATFMDTATNVLTLTPEELASRGFLLNVSVNSSTPDITPPTLGNFTLPESSVSAVDNWVEVETDITLNDNLSGFANATIRYVSPSGRVNYSATFQPLSSPDQYQAVVTLPQHVEAGIWLAQLTAVDNAGNTRVYDANDLTNLGFAPAVTVTSEEDVTPMSVVSMGFQPLQADYYAGATYTGGPFVTMSLTTSDDYAGAVSPTLLYRSQTSSQVAVAEGWSQYNDNSIDRSQFIVNLPLYAAEGDWLPEISTIDQVGNTKTYHYADLLALGFDMKVTIGDNVTEPVGVNDTVTTDNIGTGATETNPVQVAVTSPVSGTVSITAVDTVIEESDFAGYSLLPQQYSISAPEATPEDPLVLTFTVDSSQLGGVNPNDIAIFRDGAAVGQCLNSNIADPDACVKSVSTSPSGDVSITVNSSHARQWVFGTKQSTEPEFTFQGFKKPVLAAPTLNSQKSGSAVPVKFDIGGDHGLNILQGGVPVSQQIDCSTLQPMSDSIATLSTNGEGLSLSGDGYYRYNWKTLKDWSGTCRQFKLTFTTGQTAVAYFKFK